MSVPGRYRKRFRVDVVLPTAKEAETTGDLPAKDWLHGADITQSVTYIGDLERWDGEWRAVIQWVDLDERGHRIVLPHGVIDRIITQASEIMAQARSDRSRTAASTRREKEEA